MNKHEQKTTRENLEARFDAGESVLDYFDTGKAVRRNHRKQRVNLDLPVWMLDKIDRLAGRNGMPRQSQIKAWLAERIKAEAA